MRIETTRFGSIEVDEQTVLHMPAGLLGFSKVTDYVILDHDTEVPFKWLQALHKPALAFIITDPFLYMPDYRVDIQEQDCRDLQAVDTQNLSFFVLMTIRPGEPPCITINLQGPVLVNTENRWAKQLVLHNSPYHTRHPILTEQSPSP